jgi:hypothetical protein
MSGKLRIALVALTTGVAVTAFMIAGGLDLSMSIPSPALQNGLHQASARIGAETQGQSYLILAGAVRDHRSNSSVRDHRTGQPDLGSASGGVSVGQGKTRPKSGTSGTKVCTHTPFGKLVCVSAQ